METIEVETTETWTVEWVIGQGQCRISCQDGRMLEYAHERALYHHLPPAVYDAAARCIIANRPLDDDEFRNPFGGIKRFELRHGEYRWHGSEEWRSLKNSPQRIREAHDRKFPPKRRATYEQADYLNLMTHGECRAFCRVLLDDLNSRSWRPISEFVEDGQVWEFCNLPDRAAWTSIGMPRRVTHFRKFVLPEDE